MPRSLWVTFGAPQPIPPKTTLDRQRQEQWEATVCSFYGWFRAASPETATSKKHAQYFLEMRLARYLADPVYFKSNLHNIVAIAPSA